MLMPKRTKYRRPHRLSYEGRSKAGRTIDFGEFGLVAESGNYVSNRQIEAARRAITRHIKRGGRVWIRVFPDKPISSKPAEVRMGNGKGNPEFWVALVQPGRVIYELDGVDEALAREAFRLAAAKLPLKSMFVTRQIGQ